MTFLIPLLLRTGIPGRFAKAAAWIVTAIIALAIVAGCILAIRAIVRSHNETIAATAVDAHDKDLSLEAANIVLNADRSAAANQADRDEAFDNTQDQAKEAIDEAQRTRTSPLDAAFDKLR